MFMELGADRRADRAWITKGEFLLPDDKVC
jgi:hypothetical protein